MGLFPGKEDLELTEGGVAKPLFFLALPIVITNLLQTAYNLADTFWLGQYSNTALAAISFAFPMVFLFISLGLGISVAGSVLVAQNTGRGDERQAEYAASQTIVFALVASAILGAIGFVVVEDLLTIFGAEPATLVEATKYMRVISLGLPAMFGFFIFISLMRGYGDTVTPMLVMLVTVILNVVLDPFLINGWAFVPELGIEGAAYATVFSRVAATLAGFGIMFSGRRGIKIRLSDMRPDLEYLREILDIGVPASIEGVSRSLSVNLLLIIVGSFATEVVSGYGIGVRVFSVIFLPAIAVARGVETMAGQNIGAENPDRAETAADVAARATFTILGAIGILVFFFPEPIIRVFTDPTNPGTEQVIATGTQFLRYVALTFGFIGVVRAYTGAFRGAGQTLVSAVIAITFLGLIRLPVAAGLALGVGGEYAVPVLDATLSVPRLVSPIGPAGIWWGFVVSNVVGALLALAWFKRGGWRDAEVRGTGPHSSDADEMDADEVDAAAGDD